MKVNFSDYIYDIEYEKLIINQQTELKKLFKFCKFFNMSWPSFTTTT